MKKKLNFNKETIATLANNELMQAEGGKASQLPLLCSNISLCYCPESIEICINPNQTSGCSVKTTCC